jgi:hypothetical protein
VSVILKQNQIPPPKLYDDIKKWNFIYSDGYWIIKIGYPAVTKTGKPKIRWPFECWLAGEKINDGEVEVPPPFTTTKDIARLVQKGSVDYLENCGDEDARLLLDYKWLANWNHGQIISLYDKDIEVCASCKGEFHKILNPVSGICPGSDAVHGQDVTEHLGNCKSFSEYHSCRHTFHACTCNMCKGLNLLTLTMKGDR